MCTFMMFRWFIAILIFCFVEIFAKPLQSDEKLTTPTKPSDDPITHPIEICHGDECRPPPNLIGPIVGSISGVLALAIIVVFIIWFYFRRKQQKSKDLPPAPVVNFIEQPPLYTGAVSTTESTSRLYGTSPSRNDSIGSHLYEKINYGEQS